MDRKTFLQILGLSGAGVVAGCKTDSQRLLIPYLVPPKDEFPVSQIGLPLLVVSVQPDVEFLSVAGRGEPLRLKGTARIR
jgi:hypothetical protein